MPQIPDVRWRQRFQSFRKAFAQLSAASELAKQRKSSELEQQGLIQAFEFTHELAWNTLKDFLESRGSTNLFGSKDAIRLFGSRAKATHKPGSDIDLALVGPRLDWRIVGKIYDALDDLLLPFRFSLIVYDAGADSDVSAHIQRVGMPFFQRAGTAEQVTKK